MSTSTARQTRRRSAQLLKERGKSELLIEGKATRSKSRAKEQEQSIQKSTTKKKVIVPKKPKKAISTSKSSRAKTRSSSRSKTPPKSKKSEKKTSSRSKKESASEAKDLKPKPRKSRSSDKIPEKDSWGDTIFNESESKQSKQTTKTTSTKRKSEKITKAETTELDQSAIATKKTKQTKELPFKEPPSTDTSTLKRKFAHSFFERGKSKLTKEIKFIIQLDIALAEVDIPVTRQVLVSTEITFARLARIIVAAMGWKGYHDWKFVIQGDELYSPDIEDEKKSKVIASEVYLEEYGLQIGQSFEFVYNLNCNWRHLIKITEFNEMPTKGRYERGDVTFNPVVTEGRNACPPDEIEGGAKEYNKMLKVLKAESPKAEYEEIVEIYGRDYNAYEFKKKTVNNLLINFPYDEEHDITKCEHDDIFKW